MKNLIDTSKVNVGISLLKMIMCFEIVLYHFWRDTTYVIALYPFYILRHWGVSIFMLLSFYLVREKLLMKSKTEIKKRLWRLIWPQIGWAVIYWIVFSLVDIVFKQNIVNGISDLLWQIITGHSPSLNESMWFQTVLILLTVLFFSLFYYLPERIGIILICFFIPASLILQYSGLNYYLFGDLREELKYPLGRFCEMVPYASIGFLLSYSKVYLKLMKYWIYIFVPSVIVGYILLTTSIFYPPNGFGYSGIREIAIAVLFVTNAVIIPLDKLPEKVKNICFIVTKYTLGIYCIHRLIATIVYALLEKSGIETGTFIQCCMIYVLCYGACYCISRMPGVLYKRLVE